VAQLKYHRVNHGIGTYTMTIRGISFLVTALLIFAVQDSVVKHLTEQYQVLQILTLRSIIVVFIMACIAYLRLGSTFYKTNQSGLMMLRGCFAFAAFTNYYFALSFLPLGDAATVYMTAPLFVTALSVPLLGEQVGMRRWMAVVIGFTAVVFMLNPGSDLFRPIALLPLASALFYSFIPILTRKINANEHTPTITFYTTFSYAVLCLILSSAIHVWPAAPADSGIWAAIAQPWNTLNANAWMLITLSSVFFAAGVLCIAAAYRAAEVSVLAPFEYSYLLWATMVGYIVFSDVPTLRTWVAGVIIAGSGIYIAVRERHVDRMNTA